MATSEGFWSYVHADDHAEGGRLTRLAKDVAAQFEMLTGEPLLLFLDRDAIKWGEIWRDKTNSTLATVAFFIPVMTPRYFMSGECRRELQFFARQATRLGVKGLVLPLHYVDVPALRDPAPSDELIGLVGSFQWEDWRELRFLEPGAEGYRRAVARLAGRILEANRAAERADIPGIAGRQEVADPDIAEDSPGLLDRVAAAELAMPQLVDTLETITRDMQLIGQSINEAAQEINQADGRGGKGTVARIVVARKLARQLTDPAERIVTSGNTFASQLNDVDGGVRAIIDSAVADLEANPESKTAMCSFLTAVRNLSSTAATSLNQTQRMIDAIAPVEGLSRDLRPVLRRLRQGLTRMVEGKKISDDWLRLIEASGIKCEAEGQLVDPGRS